MKAGLLRHRVTIQSKTVTRNTIGEDVVTWGTHASLWASVTPLRGTEYVSLRQQGSDLTTRIRTRYVAGVIPSMRVLHGTDAYEIQEVFSPAELKAELEMLCTKAAG